MSKITTRQINDLADFLEDSVEFLEFNDMGCCKYNLSNTLALYVGWCDGYDENDTDLIHSKSEPSYCLVVGIKERNDFDFSDYMFIDSPLDEEGEPIDTQTAILRTENYGQLAKSFLEEHQTIFGGK